MNKLIIVFLFQNGEIMQGENHICHHHQSIEDVQINDGIPSAGCQFENNPCDISAKNQREKEETLACRIFHADGFHDLCRPACAETNHHDRFTNCTDVHKYRYLSIDSFQKK